MKQDLESFCIGEAASTREAIALMDAHGLGVVVVVDQQQRLVGTITDGDVRRAVLARVDLQQLVGRFLATKPVRFRSAPITAPVTADRASLLQQLQRHGIMHLPIVDGEHRVVGLVTQADFVPGADLEVQAVVMAGGFGTRLHPLTRETPKPMLAMGDRPLMAITIEQLRNAGIRQVQVATHHLGGEIARYFGDGNRFGVELSYLEEEQPLGTAGSLSTISANGTVLVVNGDILTDVNYRAMLAYHREHAACLTVAVRQYEVDVPYGVVECDGPYVRSLAEKPRLSFFVNAGIYLVEQDARAQIPLAQRFDMTDLIMQLVKNQRTVVSFPIREYWLDIGRPDDYAEGLRRMSTWNRSDAAHP